MATITEMVLTRTNASDLESLVGMSTRNALPRIMNLLHGLQLGAKQGTSLVVRESAAAGSATITLASMAAGTVLLINGVPFTAKGSAATAGNNEFDVSGGTDTLDAAALVAAINASTTAGISGVLTATSAAAVVTLTAVAPGAASNAITIENLGVVATGTVTFTSVDNNDAMTVNGVTLTAKTTVADATVEFAVGATDAATATNFAALINSTATSALITKHVRALARSNVVHLFAKYGGVAGNAITLTSADGDIVVSGARLTGGTLAQYEGAQATGTVTLASASGAITITINGVEAASETWATSDTATAAALVVDIAASTDPLVRGHVTATSSAGVVTITAVRGGHLGNAITLAAAGTGVTASGARLTGGALPTVSVVAGGSATPVGGGARLTGGTNNSALTFNFGA